jgi:hypothetical protein
MFIKASDQQGNHREWTRRQAQQFLNDVCCADMTGIDLWLDGKRASLNEVLDAADQVVEDARARRAESHKQIWVHKGASNLRVTWHPVWVRK